MKQNKKDFLIIIFIIIVLSACANANATETATLEYAPQKISEQTPETIQQNDVALPSPASEQLTLLNDTEMADNFTETPSETLIETLVDDTEQSPYIIATTIEEIENILALQDGSIPLTNIEVTASSLGFPDGAIITITEQSLQETLEILNEAHKRSLFLPPKSDLVTPFIKFSPTIDEMTEGVLFAHFRMFVMDSAAENSNFDRFNDQFTDEERAIFNAEGERLLAEYGRNSMFDEEILYNTAKLVFGERFDFE
ncbi:MAG: hypothetical protein FWG64_12430 [Firmicutes bacterium]|nr:hypothetical protein [Bacillota bacterium]